MTSTPLRGLTAILLALAFAPASHAEPAAPGMTATGNLTLASQYVSRGFRQTWGKPALQGGVDLVHSSGFSVGTWLSTMSNRYIENGTVEWDVYGGYGASVGDVGYSAILYYYKYPGAQYKATATRYDYGELSLGATYRMFYLKYNHTYTRDFFGITGARGTGYADAGANVDLGNGLTLNLHAGSGRVRGAGNAIWNWRDYKVGGTRLFDGGWSVAAAFTKADPATGAYDNYTLGIPNSAGMVDTSNPGAATFVLLLTKTF